MSDGGPHRRARLERGGGGGRGGGRHVAARGGRQRQRAQVQQVAGAAALGGGALGQRLGAGVGGQLPGVGVVVVAQAQHGGAAGLGHEAVGHEQAPPQLRDERRLQRLVLAPLRVVRLALLHHLLAQARVLRQALL